MTAPDTIEEAPGKRLAVAPVTFHSSCQQLSCQEGSQRRHRDRKLYRLQHSRVSLEEKFKIQGEG